jgi:hypothetical protein
MTENLPGFRLVERGTVDGSNAVLTVPAVVLSAGLFAADDELTRVRVADGRSLLCFGSTGLFGKICLAEESSQVIHLWRIDAEPRAIDLVNSSLEAFIRCARAVVDRFPYYDDDADDDVPTEVGAELAQLLVGIDDVTQVADSYWMTFVDDVQMGTFSTQDVLGGSEVGGGDQGFAAFGEEGFVF